jgi:Secretion system C-terminal sorting domain
MSTKIKLYTWLSCLLLIISSISFAQVGTMEMVLSNFAGPNLNLGPYTSLIGPISMKKDANIQNSSSNNSFSTPTASEATSVTISLANQQYAFTNVPSTMLNYSNISTGLVFGASPTTAVDPNFPAPGNLGVQKVDPFDIYNLLGTFNVNPGGPTNPMFTSEPFGAAGTGMEVTGQFPVSTPPNFDFNGAVSLFTAAQAQFERPAGGPPSTYNAATRYYYGDVIITFSRYVSNPVIHIAGLGGSYRYIPASGGPEVFSYFSTELQAQTAFSLTLLSGNPNFTISGNNILNSAAQPNGASEHTSPAPDLYGAATGSFRVNGTFRTLVLKVYLRGSDVPNAFAWSATKAQVGGSNRAPFTGDIWWISACAGLPQLIPLPVTSVQLTAALNGNDVSLNWKTQSELNSKQFEIERSTDGVNFTQIGTKQAAGNSITAINYNYTDPAMSASIYYYRLKMVDIDGSFNYSNVAMVRKTGGIKGVKVFPNPSVDNMRLEFSNAKGNYDIILYNQAGQQVWFTKNVNIESTVQYVNLEKGSLPAGSYIVNVKNTTSNEKYIRNVIFQ